MKQQNRMNPSLVLAEAVWPRLGWLQNVALVLAASWLIALTAQISLPMWPVPVTGQTFGVLFLAALLGRRRGVAAVMAYLAQGALGLPFFQGGTAGTAVLVGPTGGYLAGFVAAAYVVGWLCERGWDRRMETAVVAMIAGNLTIYGVGLLRLANFVPVDELLLVGMVPFLPGDILKIVLAAVLLPLGWRLLNRGRIS